MNVMNWFTFLALSVVFVTASILWDSWRSGQLFCKPLPSRIRERPSQQAVWRQCCDSEELRNVDQLLRLICETFGFNPRDRYRFAPTDRIMDLYHSCYPRWQFWNLGDSMEIESLLMDMSQRFALEDHSWHPDITLGELVKLMKSPGE
jgi:hypothetical protein